MNLLTKFIAASEEMIAAFGNCGSPRQQRAADALAEAIKLAKESAATPAEIEAARDEYAIGSDDNIEIDDDASTSRADAGTWVSAWVWVQAPEKEDNDK